MSKKQDDKIEVENVISPGRTQRVDRAKYTAVREAMLAIIPDSAPGMTPAELIAAIRPAVSWDLFPAGERVGWWVKCVQLDLEAKGLIARAPKSPVRLWKI